MSDSTNAESYIDHSDLMNDPTIDSMISFRSRRSDDRKSGRKKSGWDMHRTMECRKKILDAIGPSWKSASEIGRLSGISYPTVLKYLAVFEKEGSIEVFIVRHNLKFVRLANLAEGAHDIER